MTDQQKARKKELEDKKAKGETLDSSEQTVLDALISLEKSEQTVNTLTEANNTMNETVKGLQSGLDSLRTEFGKLKDGKAGQQNAGAESKQTTDEEAEKAKKVKDDANALQQKLTSSEEGRKLLQQAWDAQSPEERRRMNTDDAYRLSVYRYAESQLPEPDILPPWSSGGQSQSETKEPDVAKLFGKDKQRRPAPNGKESSTGDDEKKEVKPTVYSEENLVVDTRTR